MSENIEAMSAFSVYTAKRKSIEQPLSSKKKRRIHSKENKATTSQKIVTQKTIKKIDKQQLKPKYTLNTALKSKQGVVTKTGNLKIFKKNFPVVRKEKFLREKYEIDRTQLDKINNVRSINKKAKLKKEISKAKSEVKKEKNIMSFNKKKLKKSPRENPLLNRDSNGLNDANDQKDMKKRDNSDNPIVSSQKLFEWLIYPLNVDEFFQQNWENTPVHIKRGNPNYYRHLMSTPLLDTVLRDHAVFFSKNIDITSYIDGKRETHNPPGRALPSVVWDYYQNGCSVRMLNPQTFIPQLHALNATLQEFFNCFVGANSYLTPPNSQGFAPHYDDIEAFILQIEGKKRWKLYQPVNENEYLARYSSKNFDQSEIGTPILDTVINAGDLLYFPRGTIHQGMTVDDSHSLHVTLSVYQKNSWCDLFEKLLPQALQRAATIDSRFREGLPLNYLRYTGYTYDNNNLKNNFKEQVKDLLNRLIDYIDVDSAADSIAKNHIHDFLPPVLTEDEQECSVAKDGDIMVANGIVKSCVGITTETRIRLTRSHCIRLIEEDDTYKLYYSTENSKEYHEYEPQFLEVEERFILGIKSIINFYPKFVCVNDLPIDDSDEKIQIVKDLWEKGLVITDVPLGTL